MMLKRIGTAVALASCAAACTQHRNPAFVYPPAVVAVHAQAHYKTALWCTYTSMLDSSVFKKEPLNDSLVATLRGWLAVRRKLERIEQDSQTTFFHFKLACPYPTFTRLVENGFKYGARSRGLPVAMGVWVNRRDGLIDSVSIISCYNIIVSPGPTATLVAGKQEWTGPPDRKMFHYNVDQPCKAAFLQANSQKLRWDVRLLSIEKGILSISFSQIQD